MKLKQPLFATASAISLSAIARAGSIAATAANHDPSLLSIVPVDVVGSTSEDDGHDPGTECNSARPLNVSNLPQTGTGQQAAAFGAGVDHLLVFLFLTSGLIALAAVRQMRRA